MKINRRVLRKLRRERREFDELIRRDAIHVTLHGRPAYIERVAEFWYAFMPGRRGLLVWIKETKSTVPSICINRAFRYLETQLQGNAANGSSTDV